MSNCWWENQKERDQQEDLSIGGRIILLYILERYDGVVIGIRWRAVVKKVMKLRFPYNIGKIFNNFATSGFSIKV